MNWNELKSKRGFTVESSFTDDVRVQFKTSNINLAREAYNLMKENGVQFVIDGICGGKSVGGYYVSGFVSELV